MKNIFRISILTVLFSLSFPSILLSQISAMEETAEPIQQNSDINNEKNKLEASLNAVREKTNYAEAAAYVGNQLENEHRKDVFFVKFYSNLDRETAFNTANEIALITNSKVKDSAFPEQNILTVKVSDPSLYAEVMTMFKMNNNVEWVEANFKFKSEAWTTTSTTAKPSDWNATTHWYYDVINLPEVYKLQGCGAGANCGGNASTVIAVLDTGLALEDYTANFDIDGLNGYFNGTIDFDQDNQILTSKLYVNPSETYNGNDGDGNGYCDDRHGADLVSYEDNYFDWITTSDYNALCASSNDVQKDGHPNDDDGHGNFVTNVIAGAADDVNGGGFGIAHNTQIMPVKVLDYLGAPYNYGDVGIGYLSSITRGIRYAADEGADVANLSLAGSPDSTELYYMQTAIDYAKSKDMLIVAASGNLGGGVMYPAAFAKTYTNVIAVGASNPNDSKSSYSSYGDSITLVAPVGEGTPSTGNAVTARTFLNANQFCSSNNTVLCTLTQRTASNEFKSFGSNYWVGTSFAAPQVAAVAGMLKSRNNALTSAQIKTILQRSARDVGTAGYDNETGYGVLNAEAAWKPIAEFTSDKVEGNRSVTIQFTDLSMNAPTSWSWNFGDGGSSTSQNPSHNYTAPGIYNVTLTATNADGSGSLTKTGYIYVSGWSDWVKSGSSQLQVGMTSVSGTKVFQATVAADGYVRTRVYNIDGTLSQDWIKSGSSIQPVAMSSVNSKVFMATVGSDGYVRTRVFNADGTLAVDWIKSGSSVLPVALAGVNGKMFLSTVASDGYVRTRILNENGTVSTDWVKSGSSVQPVNLISVNNSKVFLITVGADKFVRTRILNSDGTVANDWIKSGNSEKKVGGAAVGTKVFIATVAADEYVRTRVLNQDGTIAVDWVKSGKSTSPVEMATAGGSVNKVLQATVGADGYVRTRIYNSDGSLFEDWKKSGSSVLPITMAGISDKVFQATVASDKYVRTRIWDGALY